MIHFWRQFDKKLLDGKPQALQCDANQFVLHGSELAKVVAGCNNRLVVQHSLSH
jgi:hypothetical protein